jgi:hypothetical protein
MKLLVGAFSSGFGLSRRANTMRWVDDKKKKEDSRGSTSHSQQILCLLGAATALVWLIGAGVVVIVSCCSSAAVGKLYCREDFAAAPHPSSSRESNNQRE